ncbi:MAG: hypothetical protein QXY40_05685 [Candidatus Methanomethylicia archaeon]
MSRELRIDAKELSRYNKEKISKLIEYIRNRMKGEVVNDGENIILKGEDIDKEYVKTLTKRFLYIEKVIDDFRVLVRDENLLLRERRKVKMKRIHH